MEMHWYTWLAISCLAYCVIICLFYFIRLVRLGKPVDFSRQAGKLSPAIWYAFTGAMNPARKESALLHLPTYFAGIVYHIGTFLSFFLFIFILTGQLPADPLAWILAAVMLVTGMAGSGILIRRIAMKKIRLLSVPDDYFSNSLVTLFQLLTAVVLIYQDFLPVYFVLFSLLVLYIPVGKLKHVVYFFAARYLLGYFYGWRGVWPPGKIRA